MAHPKHRSASGATLSQTNKASSMTSRGTPTEASVITTTCGSLLRAIAFEATNKGRKPRNPNTTPNKMPGTEKTTVLSRSCHVPGALCETPPLMSRVTLNKHAARNRIVAKRFQLDGRNGTYAPIAPASG
jgi:hypothetical protein